MSKEITLSATLAYEDDEYAEVSLQVVDKLANVATKKFTKFKQAVGITEEALVLGEVTSLGWVMIVNRDVTNYVELKTATSGTVFAKILPGEFCLFRFGSGVTAPFVIANSSPCQIEVLLIAL